MSRIYVRLDDGQASEIDVDDRSYLLIAAAVHDSVARKRHQQYQESFKDAWARMAQAAASASFSFTFTDEFRHFAGAWDNADPDTAPTPPPPAPAPTIPMPRTRAQALAVVHDLIGTSADPLTKQIRRAKRQAHPDTGGSNAAFQAVTEAERILRSTGDLA